MLGRHEAQPFKSCAQYLLGTPLRNDAAYCTFSALGCLPQTPRCATVHERLTAQAVTELAKMEAAGVTADVVSYNTISRLYILCLLYTSG